MSKRETALLCFYADKSGGFTPSLALISRTCGIPRNKISDTRASLADKKLIAIKGDCLQIDWFRLRAFAMMERQTKAAASHARYGDKNPERQKTIGELADAMAPDPNCIHHADRLPHVLSDNDPFLKAIRRMTLQEYKDWLAFPFPLPRARDSPAETAA